MIRLEGQVLVLLQGEQHRSYQGDLGGAENNEGVRTTVRKTLSTLKTEMYADANGGQLTRSC